MTIRELGSMSDEEDLVHQSHVTTDHDIIRQWVENRGATPARVKETGEDDDPGLLRIDFPEEEPDEALEAISWEQFFKKFETKNLGFLYQDRKKSGEESWFCKLIYWEGDRDDPGESTATTDQETIQGLVEEHDAIPVHTVSTADEDQLGELRIVGPSEQPDEEIERVPWPQFFTTFRRRRLAFLYHPQQLRKGGWIATLLNKR